MQGKNTLSVDLEIMWLYGIWAKLSKEIFWTISSVKLTVSSFKWISNTMISGNSLWSVKKESKLNKIESEVPDFMYLWFSFFHIQPLYTYWLNTKAFKLNKYASRYFYLIYQILIHVINCSWESKNIEQVFDLKFVINISKKNERHF